MALLLGVFAAWCVFAGLGYYVAGQKGRSEAEGLILGFLFGPFGCLIVALLPSADDTPKFRARPATRSPYEWRDEDPEENLAMEYLAPPEPPETITLDDLAEGNDGIRLGIKDEHFISGKKPGKTPPAPDPDTEEDEAARRAIRKLEGK